ncbi:MAG: HD domain-containing protein [Acidobacteria bacterium]|nr:HD domain-containing protein [Acidobacteriota bacterium]
MSRAPVRLDSVLGALAGGAHLGALYPPRHPRVERGAIDLARHVDGALAEAQREEVTLFRVGDDLVVDDHPLRRRSVHQPAVVAIMRRLGFDRLTLRRGLEPGECTALLDALGGRRALESSAHAVLGGVRLAGGGAGPGLPGGENASAGGGSAQPDAWGTALAAAGRAFARVAGERRAAYGELAPFAWQCIESVEGARPAAPGPCDDPEFGHALNVALLAIAHGQALGLSGEPLHELALAGLLHDVGKLLLPPGLLRWDVPLSDEEWEIAQTHAELGAAHLCGIDDVAPLAILVAYEHHLRWDRQPSYPRLAEARRPVFAARLIAVCDTFDAAARLHPPPDDARQRAALAVVRRRAGTFLDPWLAADFIRLMDAPVACTIS